MWYGGLEMKALGGVQWIGLDIVISMILTAGICWEPIE